MQTFYNKKRSSNCLLTKKIYLLFRAMGRPQALSDASLRIHYRRPLLAGDARRQRLLVQRRRPCELCARVRFRPKAPSDATVWAKMAAAQLHRWSFNTVGAWSAQSSHRRPAWTVSASLAPRKRNCPSTVDSGEREGATLLTAASICAPDMA